ncbi:hypothetical protein MSAN_00975800 [Mycena sanguinolenta]|uniref:Uncharacterized protein n=1 Tax=Mycena sanguinolenta TaxID=230812 RepID=A0A8H6Z0J6_9AGAR|nr:hypothetical protein MSAN_00975800 [Mycena sanguinolenta]
MPRRAKCRTRCCRGCDEETASRTCGAIVWAVNLPVLILMAVVLLQPDMESEKRLRSLITDKTPISAFYGPGIWWAWLITLGMAHADMVVTSLSSVKTPEVWDYDLIGASAYVVVAAIDLAVKARVIRQLGGSACESPLLPAMFCAERVVSVGTGASLFTIAMGIYIGGPVGHRRAAIAIIPIVFAVIGAWFSFGAHQTIFRTDLHNSCTFPDGSLMRKPKFSFVLVDVPDITIDAMTSLTDMYFSRDYWLVLAPCVVLLGFIRLVAGRWNPALGGLVLGSAALPLLMAVCLVGVGLILLVLWVMLWGPLYIVAFFPQLGSFPLTGISVSERNQLAALLGIGVIAAFRSGRRISKAFHGRADSAASTSETHKHQGLLDL